MVDECKDVIVSVRMSRCDRDRICRSMNTTGCRGLSTFLRELGLQFSEDVELVSSLTRPRELEYFYQLAERVERMCIRVELGWHKNPVTVETLLRELLLEIREIKKLLRKMCRWRTVANDN